MKEFPLTKGLYVGKDEGDTLFLRFGADGRAIAETFADAITPREAAEYLGWDSDETKVTTFAVTDQTSEITTEFFEIQGTVISPTELNVSSRNRKSGERLPLR